MSGFGFNFISIMPMFVGFFFILVIGIILFSIFKGIKQWSYNNKQPVLNVWAKVISKRTDVRRHSHHTGGNVGHHHHHTSSSYYVTFEVESGDRMELQLNGQEYGILAEGDIGKVTFQGTRYLGFDRKK